MRARPPASSPTRAKMVLFFPALPSKANLPDKSKGYKKNVIDGLVQLSVVGYFETVLR